MLIIGHIFKKRNPQDLIVRPHSVTLSSNHKLISGSEQRGELRWT